MAKRGQRAGKFVLLVSARHGIYSTEQAKRAREVAVRLCREAVRHGLEIDRARAAALEADLFALCFATHDQKEGMLAFLEKRKA